MIICRHTWNGLTIAPLLAMGLLLLAAAREVTAGDWPQILGPNRNGVARDEQPLQPWATRGPPILWKYPLGDGYAGPAVAGNRVVVFHRLTDQERVEALDATTGKPVWQANFPATYGGGINSDLGPRCVPLVHGKQVFVYGAAGDLHCVDWADGKKRWSRAAYQDFDGQEGYFGAGSTPIVAANKLIVNVGGRGAGLVAFDLQTGETLWQATDDDASYSSPCLATIDGQQMVIFVTRLNRSPWTRKPGKSDFNSRSASVARRSMQPHRWSLTTTCSYRPVTESAPSCRALPTAKHNRSGPTTTLCRASIQPASTTMAFSTERMDARTIRMANCAVLRLIPERCAGRSRGSASRTRFW